MKTYKNIQKHGVVKATDMKRYRNTGCQDH